MLRRCEPCLSCASSLKDDNLCPWCVDHRFALPTFDHVRLSWFPVFHSEGHRYLGQEGYLCILTYTWQYVTTSEPIWTRWVGCVTRLDGHLNDLLSLYLPLSPSLSFFPLSLSLSFALSLSLSLSISFYVHLTLISIVTFHIIVLVSLWTSAKTIEDKTWKICCHWQVDSLNINSRRMAEASNGLSMHV